MEDRTTKPRVAVVGLLPDQNRVVEERCGRVARLAFIPSSRTSTQYPPSVEFVVLSRFTSHRSSVAAGELPRHFCRGGLSEICGVITEFAGRSRG